MPNLDKRVLWIFLFLAGALVYINSLSGEFIWDDYPLIVDNPLIKDGHNLLQAFTSELHPQTRTNYYRPLSTVLSMADYFFFKLKPYGYHLTNVGLHLLVGFFLFLVSVSLTKNDFLSFSASLLFLVHPVHTEAVAYISGRGDLLAALFVLMSIFTYLKSQEEVSGAAVSRFWSYVLSLVFAFFALLSKEITIVLPLIVLALAAYKTGAKKSSVLKIGPFFILVLIYGVLRMTVLNFASGNALLSKKGFALLDINLAARFCIFLKTMVIYLGNFFLPLNLHMERLMASESLFSFYWIGLGLCPALYFFIVRKTRAGSQEKRTLLIFSIYWFFVWLLPQSAFVLPKVMADHFLYLPSIGLFWMIASGIDALGTWQKKKIVLGLLCVYFGAFTLFYNNQWRQELTFFLKTSQASPASFRAHDSLANIYLKNNRPAMAIHEYKLILEPQGNMANIEDFFLFTQEFMKRPIPPEKRRIVSIVFYNLGVVFAGQNKEKEAVRAYEAALQINPRSKTVYNNLGSLYEKMGRLTEATTCYQKAIALDGQYVQALNNLAGIYAKNGDFKQAIAIWEKVLRLRPDYEIAQKNISLAQELIEMRKK